jgi:parallel beta-helix repeat protein
MPIGLLPAIAEPVVIDAYTQEGAGRNTNDISQGSNARLKIELNGENAGGASYGLWLAAGSSTVQGLVINRFTGNGIILSGGGNNIIAGNFIGTNSDGTAALGNGVTGVTIAGTSSDNTIGGTTSEAGNLISGNGQGILIDGPGAVRNQVQGNLIGTDVTGATPLGNGLLGLGIGNGLAIINARDNVVGGDIADARNVISGNGGEGVRINGNKATGNLLQGNLIGTDITGRVAVGNATSVIFSLGASISVGAGVSVAGPHNRVEDNVISGNQRHGIVLRGGVANRVVRNLIGTDIDGTGSLGNGEGGVTIFPASETLPLGPGHTDHRIIENTIAFNHRTAVAVVGRTNGNAIRRNSIFANGGLGTDLGADGVTQNDKFDRDEGPNHRLNFPELQSARTLGGVTEVKFSVNGHENTRLTVEFFASVSCDPSGFGEGEHFLDSRPVNTGRTGFFTFVTQFRPPVPVGRYVTATATSDQGDTSEFSRCELVRP